MPISQIYLTKKNIGRFSMILNFQIVKYTYIPNKTRSKIFRFIHTLSSSLDIEKRKQNISGKPTKYFLAEETYFEKKKKHEACVYFTCFYDL